MTEPTELIELVRVDSYCRGEWPPGLSGLVRFSASDRALALDRVRCVMRILCARRNGAWIDDIDAWRVELPAWFVEWFPEVSDELLRLGAWDLTSWLDAMESPGWEWWSCAVEADGVFVRLILVAYPYAVDPFLYLVKAAGGEGVVFVESGVDASA